MSPDLFSSNNSSDLNALNIDLADASLRYYRKFYSLNEADSLFARLLKEVAWRQEYIKVYGVERPIPRLSAWYGDPGVSYSYSGIRGELAYWTPTLLSVKNRLEQVTAQTFNGVLVNQYRDGQDSVAWHSDDEVSLGPDPIVASVSFGQSRRFQLKHKSKASERYQIELGHGSLLLMLSGVQQSWLHQVPKTRREVGPRINLTFRHVI